jgi:hypothetical protein
MLKIYSIHYNKPEYIKLQLNSFVKNINIPFEFIVINNSSDEHISKQILDECDSLGIKNYKNINNIKSLGSDSHNMGLQHFVNLINNDDEVLLIDHDIFLIDNLRIEEYRNYDICYLEQERENIKYPWPGLIYFNNIKNKNNINLSPCIVNGVRLDTGGSMYNYIKDMNVLHFNYSWITGVDMVLHNEFLHLISGSDWNKGYKLNEKLEYIKKIYNIL